jgi:2,4-dienoyl-CoA reductase-like NADH-dependent reductase (Old Yellow Enzyme family)
MDLLSPLTLRCGVTLKNRLALAPLTNGQSADDGALLPAEVRWLLRRARGGFGLVETCAAFVSWQGKAFDGQLSLAAFDDAEADARQQAALAALATSMADAGGAGIVQLVHGGARSPSRLTGLQPVAPSVFHEESPTFEVPRALSGGEVEAVAASFIDAAVRSQRAGFAGVELHGAHGYLLGQFLSRTMNTRDDQWGGSFDNRVRLLCHIARGVRAACGDAFVVGVRLSPEDRGFAKGLDVDESIETARRVADDVDFVHISLWDSSKNTVKHPAEHAARLFRKALPPQVALVAAGGVWTNDDATTLMERGADIVSVGRAAIVDPDWPTHVVLEGNDPVRGPLTIEQLQEVDVSEGFVQYLRRFPGVVTP